MWQGNIRRSDRFCHLNESRLDFEAELRGFNIKIIVKSLFLNDSTEKEGVGGKVLQEQGEDESLWNWY